jgi:hypothetical protein
MRTMPVIAFLIAAVALTAGQALPAYATPGTAIPGSTSTVASPSPAVTPPGQMPAATPRPQAPAPSAVPTPSTVPSGVPAPSAPSPSANNALLSPPVPQADDWTKYRSPYVGEQNNLANPNRTQAEITAWAQKAIATSLSFTPEDFSDRIGAAKKMFTTQGWGEYAAYLRQAQLVERVRDQKYTVSTILNGDAAIIAQDTVNGSYHWLVRTPIMITFFTKDAATGELKAGGNGHFTLTVQIGRVAKNQGDEGLAVESWKIEATEPR